MHFACQTLFFLGLLGLSGAAPERTPPAEPSSHRALRRSTDSAQVFPLACGLRLTVRGHGAVLTDAKGTIVGRNLHLILLSEDQIDCPAEGFRTVVSNGIYFTIEQQNCGGWYFIDEYITFKYLKAEGKVRLHKFGMSFIDRREPEGVLPDRVYTEKEFGKQSFDHVSTDSLRALMH